MNKKTLALRFLGTGSFTVLFALSLFVVNFVFYYVGGARGCALPAMAISYKIFVVAFLLSFLRDKTIVVWQCVFAFFIFFESVHWQYYHILIFPQEVYEFFHDPNEVFSALSAVVLFLLKGAMVAVLPVVLTLLLLKLVKNRFQIPYYGFVLLIPMFLLVYNIWNVKSSLGNRPNNNDNIYKNIFKTTVYYFVRQMPLDFGWVESTFPKYVHDGYPILHHDPGVNVIFIQGESLTFRHMGVYGYDRKNTPFLSQLKKEHKIMMRKGVPLGPCTSVSLPSFYNMIRHPVGIKQMLSAQTNLFRMAKQNGFETSFISVQSRDALSYIKSYLMPAYIDHYMDSKDFGMGTYEAGSEQNLLSYLRRVSFSKPQFLVLHEHACHLVYDKEYPQAYNIYRDKKGSGHREHEVNTYDNCMSYIDSIYKQIYFELMKRTHRPTYLIFDSDHGEGLGEQNGYYGHGNNAIRNVINIPIIVTGFHGVDMSFLKSSDRDYRSDWMSQFELSKVVAHLLGYGVAPILDQTKGYVVNGSRLDGSDGIRKVEVKSLGD